MIEENRNDSQDEIIKTESTVRVSEVIAPVTTQTNEVKSTDIDIVKNKDIAAMSYAWLLCIPIFIFRKDSPFIQKHAKQALYLFGFSLFSWFLATIPYIGWIGTILLFVYLFLMIKGVLQAFSGQYYHIPFLTDFLENDNNLENTLLGKIHSKIEESKDVTEAIRKQMNEEKETLNQISDKVHNVVGDLQEKKDDDKL